jgi:hypothetical protein
VEKLVELKTAFEIPFGTDRLVGFGEKFLSPLKACTVTSYAIHEALTWA